MTTDVKGKTKATGAKGKTKTTGLKEFLSNLATDPRKLGEFLHEPEDAMSAANLSEADKTALKSGVAGMIAARLAGVPLDQAFKWMQAAPPPPWMQAPQMLWMHAAPQAPWMQAPPPWMQAPQMLWMHAAPPAPWMQAPPPWMQAPQMLWMHAAPQAPWMQTPPPWMQTPPPWMQTPPQPPR